MTTDLEIKDNKQAYYDYKDNISSEYLEDYIKNTRGKGLRANIPCIYAEQEPAHTKGTDNKPSMGYDKRAGKYHCMTCNKMASLFDIVKYDNSVKTDTEVFTILNSMYPAIEMYKNDTIVQNRTITPVQMVDNIEIDTSYNFTDFINKSSELVADSNNHITDKGIDPNYMIANYGLKYYTSRGLTLETIKRFKLAVADNGFNDVVAEYPNLISKSNKQKLYKLILPILDEQGNCYNFTAEITNRKEIDNYNAKYKKTTGVNTMLFNEHYLKTDKDTTIFITEGIYDALSIEQMGYKAIALMGIGSTRLINLIKHYKPNTNIIMMLDNDSAGKSHTLNILNELNTLNMQNIKCIDSMEIIENYPKLAEYKDANDMLLNASDSLKSFLKENHKKINTNEDTERLENANASNNLDYFRTIEQQPAVKMVSTGFSTLDKDLKGGLRSAFYVLGAVSNLGKTAFLMQMADQVAKGGNPVLYFSLEMDKKELMARSIARTTYIQVGDRTDKEGNPIASDTFDILDNVKYATYNKDKKDVINASINIYENIAKNMYIVSGRYKEKDTSRRMTINDVEKIVKDFIKYNKVAPIVFIDYMQILAPTDPRATDKQNMDEVVDRLKQIAVEQDTPVIAISSYNRDNYYEPANLSAFKESGAIEYGADFVLALQYNGIDEIYYDKDPKMTEQKKKRAIYELIENYNTESKLKGTPIAIQLKLLKSRNSSKFNMTFSFKARYGYFKEETVKLYVNKLNAKDNVRQL